MTWVASGLTAAEIAAMGAAGAGTAAAAGGTAAAAAPAIAGAAGTAAAGAGAAGAGLTAAELAAATPAVAEGGAAMTPAVANMGLDSALAMGEGAPEAGGGMFNMPGMDGQHGAVDLGEDLSNLGQGNIAEMATDPIENSPLGPMVLGNDAPSPAPALAEQKKGFDFKQMQERAKGAQQALRFASKFVDHKGSKNSLNLMAMAAGGASTNDPGEAFKNMNGPLDDIAATIQEKPPAQAPKLSPAAAPPQSTPTTQRAQTALPPTSLIDPEKRMSAYRGGY